MRYLYSINILTLMQQIQRVNLKALKRCGQVWGRFQKTTPLLPPHPSNEGKLELKNSPPVEEWQRS